MRTRLAGLTVAFGVFGMADLGTSIYVPGQIRDGFYIRPHFVSAPKPGRWPVPAAEANAEQAPLLVPEPDRDRVGEAF